MAMDLEQLGRRIAEQRKIVRRISQEKMAEDLNMYQADVSALEHGKKGSGISDLNKLQMVADYLEIPLQELMFGSGKASRMAPYAPGKMEIRWAGQKAKLVKKTQEQLASYYGIALEKVQPVIYCCGNYVIYALKENQLSPIGQEQFFGYSRIHLLVMFEGDIIGAADVDHLPLFYFIHQPSFMKLQSMLDRDMLDVSDVLRTLNPYIPLAQFTEDSVKAQEYQNKMFERMEKLMALKEQENVLLAENLYVIEECRRKGVCHMLLDAIRQMLQTETMWLNMEPVNYDYLLYGEMGRCVPAVYTRQDIQKISLNCGIAEMLGFTVDPDGWYRQLADITDPDHAVIGNVKIRKTAFRLSPELQALLQNDGELLQMGRALQLMAQTDGNGGILDSVPFRYRKQDGALLVELPSDGGAHLLGLLTREYEIRLAVSDTDLAGQKTIELSRFDWIDPEKLEEGCPYLLEMILAHLADVLH